MAVFWYALALAEALLALVQIIAGGDASQATLLSGVWLILAKLAGLEKGRSK